MTPGAAPGRLASAYRARAAALPDAQGVASLQVATWRAVDDALRGVIGPLGVSALLARSLVLAQRRHPSLAAAQAMPNPPAGAEALLDGLRAALQQQPLAEAQAAGQTLVQVYTELLDSLIGAALAERLLQPVWHPTLGNTPLQDTTP
jgi:hypothetical protein